MIPRRPTNESTNQYKQMHPHPHTHTYLLLLLLHLHLANQATVFFVTMPENIIVNMMINILSSLSISSTPTISIGTERISLNPSTFAGIFVEYPHSQNVPAMTLVILRRNLPRSPNTQTQHVVSLETQKQPNR